MMVLDILLGRKPKPGSYVHRDMQDSHYIKEIKESDIKDNTVIVRFDCLSPSIMSYREFHFIYKKL